MTYKDWYAIKQRNQTKHHTDSFLSLYVYI